MGVLIDQPNRHGPDVSVVLAWQRHPPVPMKVRGSGLLRAPGQPLATRYQ